MLQPTASRAELLLECPWPFNPARVAESESTEASRYGVAFHLGMAWCLQGGRLDEDDAPVFDEPLKQHLAAAHNCLNSWLSRNKWVKRCERHVEKSYALDLREPWPPLARYCQPPREEDHVYPDLEDFEVGGTADLVIVPKDPERAILVLDHKTGTWGDFSRPERLVQLQVLGLAACAFYERSRFVPAVLHSPKDAVPVVYSGPEEYKDLSGSFWRDLGRQIELSKQGYLRVNKLCGRCPVRAQCPAKSAELLQEAGALVEKATLVGSELVLVSNTNGQLSREEKIGRLHLLMSRFRELDERAVAEMKSALEDDPSLEPIRPDGKTLSLKTRTVERVSKFSILKALGPEKGEELLQQLREAGALVNNEEVILWAK